VLAGKEPLREPTLPGREGFLKVPIMLAWKEPWRASMLPSVQLGFDVTLADAGVDVPGFTEAMNSGDVLLAVRWMVTV
jgi:hypothetical protein